MGPLDASIVNVGLPFMASALGMTLLRAEWVITAYFLVITVLLLVWGRLGDMVGHRSVYLGGFAIFALGSLACGLAPSGGMLIGARVVQALGAGMMMAVGPALVARAFPPGRRGQALGLIGMVVAAALAVGPPLGGFLVERWGWRSLFLVNLPVAALGIAWGRRVLPRAPGIWGARSYSAGDRTSGGARDIWSRFDWAGAVLLGGGLLAWLLFLSEGQKWGWSSPPALSLGLGGAVGILFFLLRQRRVEEPMLDLGLFRSRTFSGATSAALLNFMGQSAVLFLLPFYLREVRGLEGQEIGLLLLPAPLAVLVVAPLAGTLADRVGARPLSFAGQGLIALNLFLLSRLAAGASTWQLAFLLGSIGVGGGLFQPSNNTAIMNSVPFERLGTASGMLATMRNLGMSVGVAVAAAILEARRRFWLGALGPEAGKAGSRVAEAAQHQAFAAAFTEALAVAGVFAVLGTLVTLIRGPEAVPGGLPRRGSRAE